MSESDPEPEAPVKAQPNVEISAEKPAEEPPSEKPPSEKPPASKPDDNGPGKADVIALGVGCLIVIIFFVAIGLVGLTRE